MSDFTRDWDESSPLGSAAASTLDDIIKNLKVDIAERLEDYFGGFTSGETAQGLKYLTLQEQIQATIDAITGKPVIFSKDVGGVLELCFKDGDENTRQITSAGKLLVQAADGVAMLTGDQTIAGLKTFSTAPQCAVDPAAADDMVRNGFLTATPTASKGVLYDSGGKVPAAGISAIIGASASKTVNTAYEATTDGFVVGFAVCTMWDDATEESLAIGTSDTETGTYAYFNKVGERPNAYAASGNDVLIWGSFCVPVKKGKWYKALSVGDHVASTINWIPLGA